MRWIQLAQLCGDIMKIEIFFLKSNDILSETIKKLTQGKYSHCGFLYDGTNVWDTDFTRKFSLRYLPWDKSDFDTIKLDLKSTQLEEILSWCQYHNNFPYDNVENIQWLFGKQSNGDAKLNCCESVIDCLSDCGVLNTTYKDKNLSPSEVYHILNGRISG